MSSELLSPRSRKVNHPVVRTTSDEEDARIPRIDCSSSNETMSDVEEGEEEEEADVVEKVSPSLKPSNMDSLTTTKLWQMVFGAGGIYVAYLYYGLVQEDLFRYRTANGTAFTHVWALQVVESSVTCGVGAMGRSRGKKRMPATLFLHAGSAQLLGKILMSLSLAAGLSFPVVVLAKSAKILPVMMGQFILGGSKYKVRDYLFGLLIVSGTALVSVGSSQLESTDRSSVTNTKSSWTGITLIFLSLCADGLTGGLQKKLKRDTAMFQPNAFDFLYYSHMAQFAVATVICVMTGEFKSAVNLLRTDWQLLWYAMASCVCSAVGQCFIFYVIATFDPLVCATITTTRKMMSVLISLLFKGHSLSGSGYLGLGLAVLALFLEIDGKVAAYRKRSTEASM